MPIHQLQTNFSSGELDPLMIFRVDTGAYQNGAKSLRNGLLLSTGGVARRPGTMHLANLTGRGRLLPFEFSVAERYVLCLSNGRLDVYSTAGALLTSVTSGCNWTTATLFELTYTQVADTMIVCHQDWQPQVIKRTGLSTFVVEDFAFTQASNGQKIYQPYYKFVDDPVTISCSGVTGSVTVTANAAVFTADMVGQRLRWKDIELAVTAYISTTQLTATVQGTIIGRYEPDPFRTTAGSGVVEVTHVAHGFLNGASITLNGASDVGGITSVQLTGTFTITVLDDNRYSITTAGSATLGEDGGGPSVEYTGSALATTDWSEPVFCERNGWPAAVCFHEARLWFGGTGGIPDGLWGSVLYQYFNFDVGEGLDSDSIQVTVGAEDISSIRHLVSHRDLLIFTALGEFFAPPPNNNTLTPATMRVRRQTPYGAAAVCPLPLDGATLYVQGSGTAVREFMYNEARGGYESTNLNILSAHMVSQPKDMAVLFGSTDRSEQYALLINDDGSAAVFHSARAENLAGWTPWDTEGSFDSVCVVGETIYFAVERAGTYRLEAVAADRSHSLDGATIYTGAASDSWTVGAIYYNKTVAVNSGNYHIGTFLVGPAGELELPVSVTEITVGFDYTFAVEILPVHVQLATGPATGLPKRINRVIVGLHSTLAVSIEGNRLILRQVTDDLSVEPDAVTGTYEFWLLGWQKNAVVTITQSEPLACTIIGLQLEVTI
jgi:hypothetical protein